MFKKSLMLVTASLLATEVYGSSGSGNSDYPPFNVGTDRQEAGTTLMLRLKETQKLEAQP